MVIAKIYANLINEGYKTIEEVPLELKDIVLKQLENSDESG